MLFKIRELVVEKGLLRGPFGGALKKEIFVPKGEDTYKVYEQGCVLNHDHTVGNYYISKEYFCKKMKNFEVLPDDILVSCSGVNYGAIYKMPANIEKGIINQALLRIRLNNDIVDGDYFCFLFDNLISNIITSGSGDSTIPNFPPLSSIKEIEVDLPELDEQKKIASFLMNYKKMISTNNLIIESLTNKIKDSLSFYYSELEKHEYKTTVLEKFVETVSAPYDSKEIVPLIDLSIMESGSLLIKSLSASDKYDTNLKIMEKGSILFGSIRPYLKKCCIAFRSGAVTGTVIQFKVKEKRYRNFVFANMISDSFFNYAINYSTGTKMPVVKSKDLLNYPLKINDKLLDSFEINNDYIDLLMNLLDENIYLNEAIEKFAPLFLDKKLILQ